MEQQRQWLEGGQGTYALTFLHKFYFRCCAGCATICIVSGPLSNSIGEYRIFNNINNIRNNNNDNNSNNINNSNNNNNNDNNNNHHLNNNNNHNNNKFQSTCHWF